MCAYLAMFSLSPSFPHLNPGANYWASHSVKCTAVVTVSAPWAVKFVCILTVGGFTPHPQPPPPLALHHSVQKNYRISPACQPQSASVFIFFSSPSLFCVYIIVAYKPEDSSGRSNMESERTCLKGKERSSEITAINYNFFTTYLAVQNSSGRGKKKRRQPGL